MENKPIAIIVLLTLAGLNAYSPSPLTRFIVILSLSGVVFSFLALSGLLLRDMTWAVLLGGAVYTGLSLIAPVSIRLAVSLAVILVFFLIPLSSPSAMMQQREWPSYSPLALVVVAVSGVYLGSSLTPWIVVSPVAEAAIIDVVRKTSGDEAPMAVVYYGLAYTLCLFLNPLLIAYVLGAMLLKTVKPSLNRLWLSPVDSLVRLALWVGASWILGL